MNCKTIYEKIAENKKKLEELIEKNIDNFCLCPEVVHLMKEQQELIETLKQHNCQCKNCSNKEKENDC